MKTESGKGCRLRMIQPAKFDRHQSQGFTLIELLIAMSLTAMIGVLAVQFLGAAIDAETRSTSLLEEINEVEQVWQLLARDLEQIAMSPLDPPVVSQRLLPQDNSEATNPSLTPSLIGGAGWQGLLAQTTTLPGGILLFARHGWENPLQQMRSDVQRVMYRLEGKTLIREYWQENHQPVSSTPTGRLHLLASVSEINIEFLPALESTSGAERWVSDWPVEALNRDTGQSGQDEQGGHGQEGEADENAIPPVLLSRPLAVAITIETESMGRVHRLFPMPGL